MAKLVRLVSACSVVILGAAAVPTLASAATGHEEKETSAADSARTRMFERALAEVELRPEQRERIEMILEEGERRYQPVREAKRDLMMAVAGEVEKGKVDRCDFTMEIQSLATAMADVRPKDRAALEQMHAILDKEQRGQLVRGLVREWIRFERQHAPSAMAEEIAEKLDLSNEQQTKLRQIFVGIRLVEQAQPEYAARRERWAAVLLAFKTDRFVIDEVAPMRDVAEQCTRKVEGILTAVDAMLPVLTREQHMLLAQKLRQKAQAQAQAAEAAPSLPPVVD